MELFKLLGRIAIENGDANAAIDSTTKKVQDSESKLVSSFKKIAAAVAAAFTIDKIVQFGKTIIDMTASVAAEQSAFEQIMGDYSNTAQEKVNEIADATGMVATRLIPYMTSMTAKFKGLGFDIVDATDYASRGLNLAADAAAFWDMSLDESTSHLNSFINGSYEGGEAIGLFANDTQMAMYAVEKGIVSAKTEWANLDEATKQATRLEYAENMFALSGATGQAAKEAGQYANVQANLNEKWRQFKAQIGEPLLQNVVLPAMEKLSGLVDILSWKFEELKTWVSENQDTLAQWASVAKTIITIVGIAAGAFVALKAGMAIQGLVQGWQEAQIALSLFSMQAGGASMASAALNGTLKLSETLVGLLTGKISAATLAQETMTKAQLALNGAIAANPIAVTVLAIVAAIAVLAAAFAHLWKTNEDFRNNITETWNKIKETISNFCQGIVDRLNSLGFDFKNITEVLSAVWDGFCNLLGPVFEGAFNHIAIVLSTVLDVLLGIFDFFIAVFNGDWAGAWEAIKGIFISIWNYIVSHFQNIMNILKGVADVVLGWFGTNWNSAWSSIKDFFVNIWNGIKDFFTSIWNGALKPLLTGITDFLTGVFTGNWSMAWNGVKSILEGITNGIIGSIEWMVNQAINLLNGLIGAINEALGLINQVAGTNWNIPTFDTVEFGRVGSGSTSSGNKKPTTAAGTVKNNKQIASSKRMTALATGMDFVPYDEFPATLHKGEMVLPAGQADYIRSGALAKSNEQIVSVLNQILGALEHQDMSININNREFGRLVKGVT